MTPRTLLEPARLAGASVMRCQSDARLVDLARAGNDRAFEAIVERYRRPILRYCTRLLPAAAAEDVVQQVFANAYSAMHRNDAELQLRPWLYRIAHNTAINSLRSRANGHEQLDEDAPGMVSLPGAPSDPQLATERREQLREIVASVKALPERQQSALVLRELEGRSYEEIAAELGLGVGAVRALLNRARTGVRAAATAFTPIGVLNRAATSGRGHGPMGERIAELTAASGAAGGAKVAAAVLATGVLIGGVGPAAVPSAGPGAGDAKASALSPHREARARARPGSGPVIHTDGATSPSAQARAKTSAASPPERARQAARSSGGSRARGKSRATTHTAVGSVESSKSSHLAAKRSHGEGDGEHEGSGSADDRGGSGRSEDGSSGDDGGHSREHGGGGLSDGGEQSGRGSDSDAEMSSDRGDRERDGSAKGSGSGTGESD